MMGMAINNREADKQDLKDILLSGGFGYTLTLLSEICNEYKIELGSPEMLQAYDKETLEKSKTVWEKGELLLQCIADYLERLEI
jgi:hypothetical protein